jgi:hypothetical protein
MAKEEGADVGRQPRQGGATVRDRDTSTIQVGICPSRCVSEDAPDSKAAIIIQRGK